MKIRLRHSLLIIVLLLVAPLAFAQDLEFRPPASAADASIPAVMRDLAVRILPVYQERDTEKYLSNLFALQLIAGDPNSAWNTRQTLRDRQNAPNATRPADRAVLYDIYSQARSLEASNKIPFQQAFAQAYRDTVPKLNDRDAFTVTRWFGTPLNALQGNFQRQLDQYRAKGNIPLQQAVDLVWTYLSFSAYRSFGPLVTSLDREEDQRRYITEEDVEIKTPDGARLAALVIRPKSATKPLPTLLEFTVYEAPHFAREAASHGYVAVIAYGRGANGSSGRFTPFQNDGADARAVINWIAKQAWSDKRVGMYGVAYSGFAVWAAARNLPPELKAIATTDATAPGVDSPMTGNIFQNSAYRWVYQLTHDGPEDKTFADDAQWRAFNQAWYTSGRRYREFPSGNTRADTIFRTWLSHPSYDRYWAKFTPGPEQFAHLDIPVLTTTGYFADGEVGALHFFTQHLKHNPKANHVLLIGPYDDGAIQRTTAPALRGYALDPAALVDLREVQYQWFDHALKGAKRPALLKERVNFQVMGSNEWRSAPSLEAMGKGALKFYLEEDQASDINRLLTSKPEKLAFLPQTFDLADRSDGGRAPPLEIVTRDLKPHNGEVFVSEPLSQATEVAGLFSGHFDLVVNKVDMDMHLALYEQLASGEYVRLADPYEFRASYVKDRSKRRLFGAGVRQQIQFKSERLTGRRLQAGSRVVLVLGIVKRADRQLNYGTGNDVSEESLDDATVPLRVRWYNTSYIELPVRSPQSPGGSEPKPAKKTPS